MRHNFALLAFASFLLSACIPMACGGQQSQPSAAEQKIAALKDALKNGLLTQAEYNAKVKALNTGIASPSAGNGKNGTPTKADIGPLKTVTLMDPLLNMVALTMQIPANWNFEGTILYMPGCTVPLVTMAYRVSSPDMLYGVQMTPDSYFYWADDSRARPIGRDCKALQPISAANYGALVSIRMRPGSEVDSVEAAPGEPAFKAFLENADRQGAEHAASYGNLNPMRSQGEMKRLHIHFDLNGHAEEELLDVTMTHGDLPTQVSLSAPGQFPRYATKHQFISTANVIGLRAPKGQLQAYMPVFQAIDKSLKVNPEQQARSSAYLQDIVNNQIAASWAVTNSIIQQNQQQRAQIQSSAQQFIRNMEAQGVARREQFNADMDRRSAHTQDVCDYILDQQYFVNPNTGQTTTLPSGYDHTYSVQNGNWTELQPIHH